MTTHAVEEAVRTCAPLGDVGSLLVAVSGGPDSMALLYSLAALREERGWRLEAAHLDHCLRGEESSEDRRFVQRLCENLEIPLHLRVQMVRKILRVRARNLEAAARRLRYGFLTAVAAKHRLEAVVTGHTLDDVAETMALNFFRGSSARGLRGIPESRRVNGVLLVRPLLGVTRESVMAFLMENALAWREDSSNADPKFDRNWMRHVLLPLAERRFPAARQTLARQASLFRQDERILDRMARRFLKREATSAKKGVTGLPVPALCRLPRSVAGRAIRHTIERISGRSLRAQVAISMVLDALDRGHSSWSLVLPDGVHAVREYDILFFEKKRSPPRIWEPVTLEIPGQTLIPSLEISVTASIGSECPDFQTESGLFTACFDANQVGEELEMRPVQPGDRIQPLGMEGTRKVKDILIDAKVPRSQRGQIPLVCASGKAIWIVGHRMDHRYRVTDRTRQILKLEVRPLEGSG